MPNRVYECRECYEIYISEEAATNCEKKHVEKSKEKEKIHIENKKMRFPMYIEITRNAFETHQGGLKFDIPKNCSAIILMGNRGGGLQPYRLLLPHQVYISDIRDAFTKNHFEVISFVPVNHKDYVDLAYKDSYSADKWSKAKTQKYNLEIKGELKK